MYRITNFILEISTISFFRKSISLLITHTIVFNIRINRFFTSFTRIYSFSSKNIFIFVTCSTSSSIICVVFLVWIFIIFSTCSSRILTSISTCYQLILTITIITSFYFTIFTIFVALITVSIFISSSLTKLSLIIG
jgi:hypothetical protein